MCIVQNKHDVLKTFLCTAFTERERDRQRQRQGETDRDRETDRERCDDLIRFMGQVYLDLTRTIVGVSFHIHQDFLMLKIFLNLDSYDKLNAWSIFATATKICFFRKRSDTYIVACKNSCNRKIPTLWCLPELIGNGTYLKKIPSYRISL